MVTIDSVQASLRAADNWERKGQASWVAKCLSSACMGGLQMSLAEQRDAENGVAWLVSQGFAAVLRRYAITMESLGAEVSAGRLPSSAIAGNYHPLVYAHAAWCVREFELGEWFVAFAKRKDVGDLSTPFWREYAAGMSALVERERFQVTNRKLRGQEKYWVTYLHVIEETCNDRLVESALTKVDEAFTKRNQDRTIADDAYAIEGSLQNPVNWDFRRYGLLNYISYLHEKQERF